MVSGADIAAAMAAAGSPLPHGHRLVSLAERPELSDGVEAVGSAPWPEFLHHDAVCTAAWPRLARDLPGFQLAVLDASGAVVAVGRSAPLAWDGTEADLPHGWDAQLARSIGAIDGGVPPDTLGALLIAVAPGHEGQGLGGRLVTALRSCARQNGYHSLIACVRPTLKARYPLIPIAEYAAWRRRDGLPFDPWIRIHVRLGGRLSRAEPHSMYIRGSVADWEEWTGLDLPASGEYTIAGAGAMLQVDRDHDLGVHWDPNVWVIHDTPAG